MNYKEGTEIYNDYYNKNPELKEIDDSLRKLPPMGGEGSVMFDKVNSPMLDAAFKYLSDIRKFSEGTPAKDKIDVNPAEITENCTDCGRCARTCPGKAISKTDMEENDGVVRWKINAEECYEIFQADKIIIVTQKYHR